jgi:hypothetical protein
MRILVCTLAVMLLSALGRAQQPAPPPPPQIIVPITKPTTTEPTPPPTGTVTVDGKKTVAISAEWLKQQSDDLLSVVACYLDKDSVDNLTNAETEKQLDVMKSIEVRIKLLSKLAKENSSSHCQ